MRETLSVLIVSIVNRIGSEHETFAEWVVRSTCTMCHVVFFIILLQFYRTHLFLKLVAQAAPGTLMMSMRERDGSLTVYCTWRTAESGWGRKDIIHKCTLDWIIKALMCVC